MIQVEKRDFGTMLYKFQVLYKNRVKRKEGSAKLLGSLSATLLVYLTFPDESSFVMEVMEQTVNSQNNSVLVRSPDSIMYWIQCAHHYIYSR